jgi:hypothetical protein
MPGNLCRNAFRPLLDFPHPVSAQQNGLKGKEMFWDTYDLKLYGTKSELREVLTENMRKILRNGVTVSALKDPSRMGFDDIVANCHLMERLYAAAQALRVLNGYSKGMPEFALKEE